MELEKLFQKLSEARDRISTSGNWNRPQVLSELAIQIGTYLTYLGEYLPKLEQEYLAARSEEYKRLLAEGTSHSQSETQARYSTEKERYQFERVKQLHKDFQQLISIIQTHLRIMGEGQKGLH